MKRTSQPIPLQQNFTNSPDRISKNNSKDTTTSRQVAVSRSYVPNEVTLCGVYINNYYRYCIQCSSLAEPTIISLRLRRRIPPFRFSVLCRSDVRVKLNVRFQVIKSAARNKFARFCVLYFRFIRKRKRCLCNRNFDVSSHFPPCFYPEIPAYIYRGHLEIRPEQIHRRRDAR